MTVSIFNNGDNYNIGINNNAKASATPFATATDSTQRSYLSGGSGDVINLSSNGIGQSSASFDSWNGGGPRGHHHHGRANKNGGSESAQDSETSKRLDKLEDAITKLVDKQADGGSSMDKMMQYAFLDKMMNDKQPPPPPEKKFNPMDPAGILSGNGPFG